jgi:spermidine/putrescine transport system ATP-binding protein
MSVISIQELRKQFGNVVAVEGSSFDVGEQEFVSILGPSGSGKSTILRMIAGFEEPTSGSITIHGEEVVGTPPFDRDVNMVFQHLALFPHLSVSENIGYGLKQKGVPKDERRERTLDMLEIVDLAGYEDRNIDELSGGEQQRVALARALVNEPSVVLFDEPLASLDRKLRQRMQFELQRIQEETGITFLYVTHDQEVAMSISDRMVILDEGQIEQIGTPEDIYTEPESKFVAQFIGDANSVEAEILNKENGTVDVLVNGNSWNIDSLEMDLKPGQQVDVSVRPEDVTLRNDFVDDEWMTVRGSVENRMFRGDNVAYMVNTSDGEFLVIDKNEPELYDEIALDDEVHVGWRKDDSMIFVKGE